MLTQVPRPSEFAFDVTSPAPHCPDQNLLSTCFLPCFLHLQEGVVLVGVLVSVLGRGEAGTVYFSKQGRGIKVPPSTPNCIRTCWSAGLLQHAPLRPWFERTPLSDHGCINASGTMEESIRHLAF